MERIRPSPCVLIIGKRETGKTTLVREIIRNLTDVSPADVTVFCSNPEEYDGMRTFTGFDEVECDGIIKAQRQAFLDEKCGDRVSRKLIVLDGFAETNIRSRPVEQLFTNGRFLRIGLIVTMQYPAMPAKYRANTDVVFAFREGVASTKSLLYKNFFTVFPTEEEFVETFDRVTSQPHTCIVFDNCCQSNEVPDCVLTYRVEKAGT